LVEPEDPAQRGALFAALTGAAFAQAPRIERGRLEIPGHVWLFSRRNAILGAVPFAVAGSWNGYIVVLALYAAASFFVVQHVNHGIARS
jgi:hypothetical protein